MFGLGVQELLLILLIAMFFFGGKQLPEIARGRGRRIAISLVAPSGRSGAATP